MKTHILHLETYDDLVSACDKLTWAKADRILLVWPIKSKNLNRKLDLLILKRQSLAQGAQLALVTRDSKTRSLANHLGIPTYHNIRKAQSSSWRLPHRFRNLQNFHSPVKDNPKQSELPTFKKTAEDWRLENPKRKTQILSSYFRFIIFLLGTFAFLSIAAILYPRAEIKLEPVTQWQTLDLTIQANEKTDSISLDGKIPANRIYTMVEARESIPVSGIVLFPDSHAVGEVEFTNLTDKPLEIPIGTYIRSEDGQRFVTTIQTTLPSEGDNKASVTARCVLPGEAGNLKPGSINTIEGNLSTLAKVNNLFAFHSGENKQLPAPTEADRRKLSQNLYQELEKSAIIQLEEKLSSRDILLPDSLSIVKIHQEVFSPSDNSPSNFLELSLRLEFQAYYLRSDDLESLSHKVLDAKLPKDIEIIPKSLTYSNIKVLESAKSGEYLISLTILRKTREKIIPAEAITKVIGLPITQAKEQLHKGYTLSEEPSIQMQPAWWPRTPFIPLRITIQVID